MSYYKRYYNDYPYSYMPRYSYVDGLYKSNYDKYLDYPLGYRSYTPSTYYSDYTYRPRTYYRDPLDYVDYSHSSYYPITSYTSPMRSYYNDRLWDYYPYSKSRVWNRPYSYFDDLLVDKYWDNYYERQWDKYYTRFYDRFYGDWLNARRVGYRDFLDRDLVSNTSYSMRDHLYNDYYWPAHSYNYYSPRTYQSPYSTFEGRYKNPVYKLPVYSYDDMYTTRPLFEEAWVPIMRQYYDDNFFGHYKKKGKGKGKKLDNSSSSN